MTAKQKAIQDKKHFDANGRRPKFWHQCQNYLRPLSKLQDRMDVKWGVHGLIRRVSSATASRWAVTADNLWQVLDRAADETEDQSQVMADLDACMKSCIRGLELMDAEAHELNPDGGRMQNNLEWKDDGLHFVVIADGLDAPLVPDGVRQVTMREVACALSYYDQAITFEAAAKNHFPDARMKQQPKTETEELLQDEIKW
jgi:hypothetical protein